MVHIKGGAPFARTVFDGTRVISNTTASNTNGSIAM